MLLPYVQDTYITIKSASSCSICDPFYQFSLTVIGSCTKMFLYLANPPCPLSSFLIIHTPGPVTVKPGGNNVMVAEEAVQDLPVPGDLRSRHDIKINTLNPKHYCTLHEAAKESKSKKACCIILSHIVRSIFHHLFV